MTITITEARNEGDLTGLQGLLEEYLGWDIAQLAEASGISLDPGDYVQNTLDEIALYYPPDGRLLLAREGGVLVGMAFMKPLGEGRCEIKRMYVRPLHRGQGLGRRLLVQLIEAARTLGYAQALLDSTTYMESAHGLYRLLGFRDIDYYPEAETDEALKPCMVYMALDLV